MMISNILRRIGWDIHRADPDRSPDLFRVMLLDHLGVDCVIDVGANVGQFALGLRQHGYHGTIVSFEPVGDTFAQLERTARADRYWQVRRLALGRVTGTTTMTVPPASNLASFRRLHDDLPVGLIEGDRTMRTETVGIETLARIGASLPGARVYLKLDTQGYDLEVIEGCGAFLDRVVAIQTELSILPLYEGAPTIHGVLPRLAELGYVPSTFIPVFRDPQLRLREADCILVRT